ncbi:MAG: hypothetical protein M3R24_41170 [Chloroflexota bacterium]|nr:hypothetical protein [Chloroflexota bacterium]
MATGFERRAYSRFPLLVLLHPREQTQAVVLLSGLGLLLWGLVVSIAGMPIWGATTAVISLLLIPAVQKWRADWLSYGPTAMVLSILLAMQGFHSIEHLVQWIQFHILHWPPWESSGLISPANAEWIHFVWNWTVVAVVAYLIRGGMRNYWAWLLLAWAIAHSLEHTYLMVRYLELVQELRRLGVPFVSAQGLPGVLGRDGWLARSPATEGSFLCRLPGLTTAPRLDVHFWWNTGETSLLCIAGSNYLRNLFHCYK